LYWQTKDVEILIKNTIPPEMSRFNEVLHRVMQVSKADLSRLLEDEKAIESAKQKPGRKPNSLSSDPASHVGD
jgi:hypothetical protein